MKAEQNMVTQKTSDGYVDGKTVNEKKKKKRFSQKLSDVLVPHAQATGYVQRKGKIGKEKISEAVQSCSRTTAGQHHTWTRCQNTTTINPFCIMYKSSYVKMAHVCVCVY